MTEQLQMDLQRAPWQGYQSRYVAYCKSKGSASPEEMMARDRDRWPGGLMTGYILWISRRWRRWAKTTGRKNLETLMPQDHESFDAWLANP